MKSFYDNAMFSENSVMHFKVYLEIHGLMLDLPVDVPVLPVDVPVSNG